MGFVVGLVRVQEDGEGRLSRKIFGLGVGDVRFGYSFVYNIFCLIF